MSGVDFLLDTNILIGLLKQHAPAIALLEKHGVKIEQAGYSAVTRMELLGYPGLQTTEREAITRLLENLTYYPIDRAVEDQAIETRAQRQLKLPDAIILATAQVNQLTLITLDERLQRAAGEQADPQP
jgi:predicted nucleic acid-binding protein